MLGTALLDASRDDVSNLKSIDLALFGVSSFLVGKEGLFEAL